METKNLRNIVLNLLIETLEEGKLSHHVLATVLERKDLSVRERKFINRLYAGTLEKLICLDYLLNQFSTVPVRKQKPVIRNILRLSVYQLRFMDAVPDAAVISEAVKLTRKRGFQNLTGFVNAVLRKVQRDAPLLDLPDYVRMAAPEWIWKLINTQYGYPAAERFFHAVQDDPSPVIFRPNLVKSTKEEVIQELETEGCQVRELGISNACILKGFDSLTDLSAFRKGYVIIQDIGSMMASEIAAEGLTENRLTIDVCAAPGGKSLFIAEKFPQARILSRDLTERKIELLNENCRRLGITNLETQVWDARVPDPLLVNAADVVLADLPCSGLGVLRRKPDIMYRLQREDLISLCDLQREILSISQVYVKPGGRLVYSTCTVNQEENQAQTRWFSTQFPFILEKEIQYLPGRDPGDGFYIARFRRNI